jgi:hypothetical protein
VRLKAENLADLRALTPLAPLHQPHNLSAIDSRCRKSRVLIRRFTRPCRWLHGILRYRVQ